MKKYLICIILCAISNATLYCDESTDKANADLIKLKEKLSEEGWTEEEIAVKLKSKKDAEAKKENISDDEALRRKNRREGMNRNQEKAQTATRKLSEDENKESPNLEKKEDINKRVFTEHEQKECVKRQIEELKTRLINKGKSAEEIERVVKERTRYFEKDAENKSKWLNGTDESRKILIEDIKKVMSQNGRKDFEIENYITNAIKRWESK